MSVVVAQGEGSACAASATEGNTSGMSTCIRWMRADECLEEVSRGIGTAWGGLPLYGATRDGRAPAKEAIGKNPERYKPVQPGSVFYNPMRILLGSIAMLDDNEPAGITSPDYVVVRGRPGVLHHRVFYYWFRSGAGEQLIRDLARGGVRERILFNRLCEGLIPVLPWHTQTRLAEQLAIVPSARRAATDRLATAEELPAALLREVFDSEQAQQWATVALGDLVRTPIRTGISKSGGPHSEKRCLTLSAVRGRTLLLEACKPAEVTDAEAVGNWLRPGCFYVVRGNGNRELVGRGAFAPDPVASPILFPDLLFEIDLAERADPSFFWCLWSSAPVRQEIEARARTAAGIYKINTANLKSLPLRLPVLHDQRRVAQMLSRRLAAAEEVVARCREELAVIEAIPAALLREAFGGSIHEGA